MERCWLSHRMIQKYQLTSFHSPEARMRTTEFGKTGINASVLGFGCSAIMGRTGRKDSIAALEAAWDAGITIYDTARSYGYGESEALLGEFLQGKRSQAVISTKFGILASRQQLWKRAAKPLARTLLSLVPGSHTMLRKQAAGQFTGNQFTLAVLQTSLEESLRKLRTDYVDFLFMHAAPASVLEQDDLLSGLAKLVEAGKVRSAGISADPDVIGQTLRRNPASLTSLQFPCNIFDLSAANALAASASSGKFAAIANHPFGGSLRVQQGREKLISIARAEDTPTALRQKLGSVDDQTLADVVLNMILSGTGIHTVVPAMMKVPHLKKNVAAINNSRFTDEDIQWLRKEMNSTASHADVPLVPVQ
jgi:aryl-alcohol dehydrogenase-like predicted oxidoreductase